MAGKQQGIVFGKVSIFSETENLTSMRDILVKLIREIGYPSETWEREVKGEEKDAGDESGGAGGEVDTEGESVEDASVEEMLDGGDEAEEPGEPAAHAAPEAPWLRKRHG